MRLSRRWLALSLLALTLCLAALAGCNALRPSETMTVLAGSELKDIEPLLDEIERNTGVRLELEYTGTLNGVEALLDGADYDLAWFSHGKYLDLLQTGRNIVVTQEKTMLSPVVLGVKESKARSLGWLGNPNITWRDIAQKASTGELRYAMTNPAASNSGFHGPGRRRHGVDGQQRRSSGQRYRRRSIASVFQRTGPDSRQLRLACRKLCAGTRQPGRHDQLRVGSARPE